MAQARKQIQTETAVSAGGVIYKKEDGKVEIVLTSHDERKVWNLPKGLVEEGEGLEETALREVNEETGLTGEIVGKIGKIDYWFYWKPKSTRYHKFVHFYLVKHTGGNISKHDWEVTEARWFPVDEAIEKLSYKNEKAVVEKAKDMIEKLAK